MPRADEMFGDIVDPSVKVGTRRSYTMPLSVVIHTAAILGVVVIPLVATDILPVPPTMMSAFMMTSPPPSPPPLPRQAAAPKSVVEVSLAAAPTQAPAAITPEIPVDATFDQFLPGNGQVLEVMSILPSLLSTPSPQAPPVPVRVGGVIRPPTKTRHVNPQYPPIAQAAGVSGIVILEAIIGPDGRVQDAKVLRSMPLLDQAALDAVRQWEFTPTLLNGLPTPVIMTVTVQFSLSR